MQILSNSCWLSEFFSPSLVEEFSIKSSNKGELKWKCRPKLGAVNREIAKDQSNRDVSHNVNIQKFTLFHHKKKAGHKRCSFNTALFGCESIILAVMCPFHQLFSPEIYILRFIFVFGFYDRTNMDLTEKSTNFYLFKFHSKWIAHVNKQRCKDSKICIVFLQ